MQQVNLEPEVMERVTQRLEWLAKFADFTEDDADAVRKSGQSLMPQLMPTVNSIYQRLLAYPDTAQYFEGGPLAPPPGPGKLGKPQALTLWLATSLNVSLTPTFAAFMYNVGDKHSKAQVPYQYLVATMSIIQDALTGLVFDAGGNDSREAVQAWNKLLMIELDLMHAAYEDGGQD